MKSFAFLVTICLFSSLISSANVVKIESMDQLNSQVLQSSKPAIIKVSAPWCGACTRAQQPYETLAADPANADVIFVEVDADTSPDIMKKFNVQSLPTFLFIQKGQEVKRTSGFSENFKTEMNTELTNMKGGAAVPSSAPIMEKKTVEADQLQTPEQQEAKAEQAEASGTCSAGVSDNFLERAYNAVRDFFTSIADTVRGWFK